MRTALVAALAAATVAVCAACTASAAVDVDTTVVPAPAGDVADEGAGESPRDMPDTRPPRIDFYGGRIDAPGHSVTLEVSCDEPCAASARGRIGITRRRGRDHDNERFGLPAQAAELDILVPHSFVLPLAPGGPLYLERASAAFRHRHAFAVVRVLATDAAGNVSKRHRRIRFVG